MLPYRSSTSSECLFNLYLCLHVYTVHTQSTNIASLNHSWEFMKLLIVIISWCGLQSVTFIDNTVSQTCEPACSCNYNTLPIIQIPNSNTLYQIVDTDCWILVCLNQGYPQGQQSVIGFVWALPRLQSLFYGHCLLWANWLCPKLRWAWIFRTRVWFSDSM